MSLSPQVCKKNYKVHIPSLGEECEFWLVRVTDEQSITNPDKDHAYYTDDGKLFIYDGKNLVRVNCDICFTQEEREKLEDIEEGANKYVLPVANDSSLGGIKTGFTQTEKQYAVEVTEKGQAYVTVPWTDTVYTLPVAETNTLGGIKTGYEKQGQNYPVLVDVDGNAYVNVPWTNTDTKYNVVSTTENGLAPMLPTENAEKKFLNGDGEWVEVNESINGNTVTGSTFSGETSDCGVQILEVQGKTVQNGTPSPDNPVEIENVEISNIFSTNDYNTDNNVGLKGKYLNDQGTELPSGSWDISKYISTPSGVTKLLEISMSGGAPAICFYDESKAFISGEAYNNRLNFDISIPEKAKFFRFSSLSANRQNEHLLVGTYNHNTIETSLALAEGDTYENGQVTRVRKQVVFDGSSDESWIRDAIEDQSVYRFLIKIPDSDTLWLNKTEQVCNRLPVGNTYSIGIKGDCFSIDGERYLTIFIDSLKNSSLEDFKAWLQEHHLEVEYKLSTPTTEEFKVPTIPSYEPYTEISTNSVVDPTITFRPLPFTTCLVGEATEEESGYMPALSGDASQFLNGQGKWTTPSGYTLPQASKTTLGGVKIGSNITVSSGTISLTKTNVVSALGYTPPTTNTTYSLATTSASGLLRQLNGNTSQFLNGNGQWATPPNTTYGVATTSKNGLMSVTDKSRLDQLWAKFDSMVFSKED